MLYVFIHTRFAQWVGPGGTQILGENEYQKPTYYNIQRKVITNRSSTSAAILQRAVYEPLSVNFP